jgi:hypothetical protein
MSLAERRRRHALFLLRLKHRRQRHAWHHKCGHNAKLFIGRQKMRRAGFMAKSHKCGDEDTYCMQRLLAKVQKLNKKIHQRAKLCGIKLKKYNPKKHNQHKCKMNQVHAAWWRRSVICSEQMARFKKYVEYYQCKRKEVFAESCECSPLDLDCLKTSYMQIHIIRKRVSKARDEFTKLIAHCDECAPIRRNFHLWYLRQRTRVLRLKDSICKCKPEEVNCAIRRVARLKSLQSHIRARREQVLNLHGKCIKNKGTHGNFMRTTEAHVTRPPVVYERFSAASVNTVSKAVMALTMVFVTIMI